MSRWSAPLGLFVLLLITTGLAVRERDAVASRPGLTGPTPAPAAVSTSEGTSEPAALALPATEPILPANPSRRAPTFDLLEDGSPVPVLDANAPRRVKLGVALFRYRGAEGAGAQSRTREEALRLATAALARAGDDFGQAVALGDPGSAIDVGWVGRSVLERAVEYPIFTAAVGTTLARPIDTPRGYWVVRRHK
jgi:hypothetical protein